MPKPSYMIPYNRERPALQPWEIFKVKIKSDGTLEKLKTRLVVRGDLQSKTISEDTWSPTASFRVLKFFLAHACKCKVRVKQLDFVGAFLRANVRA
jgi:hypothetical protein